MTIELDERREAILASTGHCVIEGGPGCGKTTIALLKAQRTVPLLEQSQQILFLSFSRAAVRQISDRMMAAIPLSDRKRIEIRTFHAFFAGMVRSHSRLLNGMPATLLPPDQEGILRANYVGTDWVAETIRLSSREGKYVFDRLAPAAAALLEQHPAVRKLYSSIYPFVLIDEFQDTNEEQWRVVRAFSKESTVVCLADPDQRIFGHIPGVDDDRTPKAIQALQAKTFDLSGDNFRSTGNGLLSYANAILRNVDQPIPRNVVMNTYDWPATCEERVHEVLVKVQAYLRQQLGREPTISVLSPANSVVSRISERLLDPPDAGDASLPAIEHNLQWDAQATAAAGYVVASMLEWPFVGADLALEATLSAIIDYYRVRLATGTSSAKAKIARLSRASECLHNGKRFRSATPKRLAEIYDSGLEFVGRPPGDWLMVRAMFERAPELEEVGRSVRQLRLFRATDALARGLLDAWDGSGYRGAKAVVQGILGMEALEVAEPDPFPVSLMSMHRSKGKEFDGVVIVEDRYQGKFFRDDWREEDIAARRRLLRVAVTRARELVVFVRPRGASPLIPSSAGAGK